MIGLAQPALYPDIPTGTTRDWARHRRPMGRAELWCGGSVPSIEGDHSCEYQKREIPVKVEARGAVARQQTDFGDASSYGVTGGEHFAMAAGMGIQT